MKTYTCDICKLQVPAIIEGTVSKQTVTVLPNWTSEPILVQYLGEPTYPCPECEKDDDGAVTSEITDWDNPNKRMHKRLRQHHARHHHMKLKDKLNPSEVYHLSFFLYTYMQFKLKC